MAKIKLNSMPDYQARMPRQPHDVGQSFAFTSSTGMELPVYYDMLHLGDELHFNGNMFTRVNPLFVAALAEVDLFVDYFFVPLSVIYTPSPSMFYQTDDLVSGIFKSEEFRNDRFPLFNINAASREILTLPANASYKHGLQQDLVLPANVFDCQGKAWVRLLNHLGYSLSQLEDDQNDPNPNSTPWFLCAYHACHELYFRNDDREFKSYDYNLDKWYDSSTPFTDPWLLHLNYASAYKDYFNSVKVSPISSSVSLLEGASDASQLLSKVRNYLTEYRPAISDQMSSEVSLGADSTTVMQDATQEGDKFFNTSSIRSIFALEKLLRVIGRADKNYESQFLAHFGVKIPHDIMHNITHIGQDKCTLTFQPVVSTANTFNGTTGSALGEIGGQGQVSMTGKKRSFTAPCHGVFMAIYHSIPRMRYFGGIDKLHTLYRVIDFWQPEYDHQGMQPLYEYECRQFEESPHVRPIGWQFNYEQFKRKYDRVSLAFNDPQSLGGRNTVNQYYPWVLASNPYAIPFTEVDKQSGRNPIENQNKNIVFGPLSLLSTPHDLDGIMQVPYSTAWIENTHFDTAHLLFQTDPFIHDFRMNCKKVNFMSEYGEPELD